MRQKSAKKIFLVPLIDASNDILIRLYLLVRDIRKFNSEVLPFERFYIDFLSFELCSYITVATPVWIHICVINLFI